MDDSGLASLGFVVVCIFAVLCFFSIVLIPVLLLISTFKFSPKEGQRKESQEYTGEHQLPTQAEKEAAVKRLQAKGILVQGKE